MDVQWIAHAAEWTREAAPAEEKARQAEGNGKGRMRAEGRSLFPLLLVLFPPPHTRESWGATRESLLWELAENQESSLPSHGHRNSIRATTRRRQLG